MLDFLKKILRQQQPSSDDMIPNARVSLKHFLKPTHDKPIVSKREDVKGIGKSVILF